jgi:hypothetical protein
LVRGRGGGGIGAASSLIFLVVFFEEIGRGRAPT